MVAPILSPSETTNQTSDITVKKILTALRSQKRRVSALVTQSCLTSDSVTSMEVPTSTSAHGILQARILEWVAISFSRRSSQPRYGT